MQTLSTAIASAIAGRQISVGLLYDIYLRAPIATKWGTTNILRLTDIPGGFQFFTPKLSPEASGTQGQAAFYNFWPLQREAVKGDVKYTGDKLQLTASNVTEEWAAMLAKISWYDVPIAIREVPTNLGTPTNDDAVVLWSGMVDSATITEKMLQFDCSSDMASIKVVAPRESMHASCRFSWGDDQCTASRFASNNYKQKTVGSGSTTSLVVSGDLTEDTGAAALGLDVIDGLPTANITASSQGSPITAANVYFNASAVVLSNNKLSRNDLVVFSGTQLPPQITAGQTYYVTSPNTNNFRISTTADGPILAFDDMTAIGEGAVLDAYVSTAESFQANCVRSSVAGYWKLGDQSDWGGNYNGFWFIPDAQSGLWNKALQPWIQFTLVSKTALRHFRFSNVDGVRREEMVRALFIMNSDDAVTWNLQSFFELPPVGGVLYDLYLPNASSAWIWRICIRSRWAQSLYYTLLNKVQAYGESRNYWQAGRVTFSATTATTALQGVSRRVVSSYAGAAQVVALPVAPAAGDIFTIERGCPRTFAACCSRQNHINFGGFTDLPYQAVIRT